MRPLPVALPAIALGALLLAAPASASPRFSSSYALKLTTARRGASAGWTADVKLRDPGDPMKRPKILTGLRMSFPAGSRFDPRGHVACRARNKPLTDKGPAAVCSRATRYGSGRAKVIVGTAPLSFPIRSFNLVPLDFNRKRPELLLDVVLDPNNPSLSFLIDGRLTRRSIFFGLDLAPKNDIHTTDIHFVVPASTRHGHAFLRTPSSCPRSGHWTVVMTAGFVTGPKETLRIPLPCRRHSQSASA